MIQKIKLGLFLLLCSLPIIREINASYTQEGKPIIYKDLDVFVQKWTNGKNKKNIWQVYSKNHATILAIQEEYGNNVTIQENKNGNKNKQYLLELNDEQYESWQSDYTFNQRVKMGGTLLTSFVLGRFIQKSPDGFFKESFFGGCIFTGIENKLKELAESKIAKKLLPRSNKQFNQNSTKYKIFKTVTSYLLGITAVNSVSNWKTSCIFGYFALGGLYSVANIIKNGLFKTIPKIKNLYANMEQRTTSFYKEIITDN